MITNHTYINHPNYLRDYHMPLSEDIDDLYIRYCLSGKNVDTLVKSTKKSLPALKRYIRIKENLAPELFPLLDSRKMMTLSLAETLIKSLVNIQHQVVAYNSVKGLKGKEREQSILNHKSCLICCDNSVSHEYMECCGNWICSSCFLQCLSTSFTELTLTPMYCPFCRKDVPLDTVCNFTGSYRRKNHKRTVYYSRDLWRNSYQWIETFTKLSRCYIKEYLSNLYKLHLKYEKFIKDNPGITDTHHLGYCESCIKSAFRSRDKFIDTIKHTSNRFVNLGRINIAVVQKDCANDEQLKPEIFTCKRCCESEILIKRCPHCGIKSLRPDGCNYVRCECGNHWCFVCNMRLPGSHEGHNVHYWTGNGSSAYDDNCRISSDHHGLDHVMKDCNCNYCRSRGGAPMCATLDCKNTVPKKSYTTEHGRVLQWGIYCEQCSS